MGKPLKIRKPCNATIRLIAEIFVDRGEREHQSNGQSALVEQLGHVFRGKSFRWRCWLIFRISTAFVCNLARVYTTYIIVRGFLNQKLAIFDFWLSKLVSDRLWCDAPTFYWRDACASRPPAPPPHGKSSENDSDDTPSKRQLAGRSNQIKKLELPWRIASKLFLKL